MAIPNDPRKPRPVVLTRSGKKKEMTFAEINAEFDRNFASTSEVPASAVSVPSTPAHDREKARRASLSPFARRYEDLRRSAKSVKDDLQYEAEKIIKVPINPTAGLAMGLAGAAPIVSNYGRTAAGALQRVGNARFAAPSAQTAMATVKLGQAGQALPADGSSAAAAIEDGAQQLSAYLDERNAAEAAAMGAVDTPPSGAKTPPVTIRAQRTPEERNAFLRQNGLTRIVKTGNGSYSDDPNAQGEARLYDEMGARADRMPVGGPAVASPVVASQEWSPDLGEAINGDPTIAAYYAQANKAPDTSGASRIAQGRDSLLRVSKAHKQAADQQEAEFLASLSPKDRAQMQTEKMKDKSANRRAQEQNETTLLAAGAGRKATLAAAGLARADKITERSDKLWQENPKLAATQLMAKYAKADTKKQDAILNSPEGSQLFNYMEENLARDSSLPISLANKLGRLFGTKPSSRGGKLDNLESGNFSEYRLTDAPFYGQGYSGEEDLGMSPELFEKARKAYIRKKANDAALAK